MRSVTTVRPDGRRVSWIGSSMVAGSLPQCYVSEYGVAAGGATRRVLAASSHHVPWRVLLKGDFGNRGSQAGCPMTVTVGYDVNVYFNQPPGRSPKSCETRSLARLLSNPAA